MFDSIIEKDILRTDRLYYTLRNGSVVPEYSVHQAFEIYTGKSYYEDSKGYSKWIHSLLGKSIVKVMKERELDVEQLVRSKNIIAAVRAYRTKHDCTLIEAKEAIDKIRAEMHT